MLDLSASDMDLGTVRPVSHVKVADAAEVQSKFYKFGPLLGRGAYGTVMLGTERSTGDKWAIKILNKAQCGQHQLALFQREIRILRAVRHPHIIHLERVLESPSALFLVLELCLGELADFAKKKKCFSENEARRVVQCLSSAVSYLHSKDIVHRDLKLENLLVAANPMDANDKLYIKVTDFGLSVVRGGFGQENMLQEQCGTPAYMAPELFGSRMYSQQCDIWAMGVIMYVMLTGKFPFEPRGNKTLPMVVSTEDPDMSGPAFKGEDKEPLKKILKKMLEKNPAYRANAHDVEMDPWTRNAAEEAPSENVMELMRMWRKDMRTPSLGTGAGAGAFSESGQGQRRGSRNSVILDNIRPPISSTPNKPGGGGARRKGNYGRPPPETSVRTAARNLAPETTMRVRKMNTRKQPTATGSYNSIPNVEQQKSQLLTRIQEITSEKLLKEQTNDVTEEKVTRRPLRGVGVASAHDQSHQQSEMQELFEARKLERQRTRPKTSCPKNVDHNFEDFKNKPSTVSSARNASPVQEIKSEKLRKEYINSVFEENGTRRPLRSVGVASAQDQRPKSHQHSEDQRPKSHQHSEDQRPKSHQHCENQRPKSHHCEDQRPKSHHISEMQALFEKRKLERQRTRPKTSSPKNNVDHKVEDSKSRPVSCARSMESNTSTLRQVGEFKNNMMSPQTIRNLRPISYLHRMSQTQLRPGIHREVQDHLQAMRSSMESSPHIQQRSSAAAALQAWENASPQRTSHGGYILKRGVVVREESAVDSAEDRGSATVLLPNCRAPPVVYVQRKTSDNTWASPPRPYGLLHELSASNTMSLTDSTLAPSLLLPFVRTV